MATKSASENEKCWKCNGSGKYHFGGATVNGIYQGKTGECFACTGKGVQTPADRRRNMMYWRINSARTY